MGEKKLIFLRIISTDLLFRNEAQQADNLTDNEYFTYAAYAVHTSPKCASVSC